MTQQVFDLDGDIDGDDADIEVFIPGPPGPPIVDVGTISTVSPAPGPTVISTSIAIPLFRRQRSFLKAAGDIDQPILANPSDDGPWELFIFWADNSHTLTLNNATNIKLSGQWVAKYASILYLQWDGNSQWVEGGRNEI